jgi:prepilin-type N-terminal cleavage/methylation domain-containing protein
MPRRRGFTNVELLVVMAVALILLTLVIVGGSKLRELLNSWR